MHIKHMHCMIEDLAEYGKCMIEAGTGNGNVNLCEAGQIVDMIKDLADAEYHSLISKEMKKAEEEDEAEEKYMIRKLKEEYKDEYKEMKERYGDEADKRFYDSWRHADGSFAKKGTGEYRPRSYYRRRGYVEPEYRMPLEMYHNYTPEELRDMDRMSGKMYYTPMSGDMSIDSTSGKTYADGVNDGTRRGYSDGYEKGMMDGRSSQSRDRREGRSGQLRRGYMETKEMHKGNTPQDKQEKMKSLESYMKELAEDVTEMVEDASNEERTMLRTKLQTLAQKV